MIPRRDLWAVPSLLALHNAEEAIATAVMRPRLPADAPAAVRPLLDAVTIPVFLWALLMVTGAAFVVAACAARGRGAGARWALVLVQAVVALNVVSHLAVALGLRGYGPGLASAVVVNLPFSMYFLARARRERWVGRAARWWLLPAALLVHGPGLVGVFVLARAFARS